MLPQGSLRLFNVGSGVKGKSGFINSDILGNTDLAFDVLGEWGNDLLLDAIYAEMLIGSLDRESLAKFFGKSYDALASGGILRICTINYENLAKLYLSQGNKALLLLQRHKSKGFPGEFTIDLLFNAFCCHFGYQKGKRPYGVFPHDKQVLEALLRRAGFASINYFSPGESERRFLMGLESRQSGEEKEMQLVLEAMKSDPI